jgi:transcription elongation factor/antiterminator RfaH
MERVRDSRQSSAAAAPPVRYRPSVHSAILRSVPTAEGRRWRLARTLAGRELVAEQNLRQQGFETFLPKQARTVRHARRIRVTLGAYFPGYLFVHLDLDRDRWRSVNGTVGVAHLVGRGERPSPVPEGVVEALVAAVDERQVLAGPLLRAGQTVRVVAGPFADALAVIERLDEAGRVRVLLQVMQGGAILPLTLKRELLAAAG